MDSYEQILFEEHGPVRLLTLNRPDTLNAISPMMEDEIHHALDVAEEDPEARVVIINGAGRAFSSGYDISASSGRQQYNSAVDPGEGPPEIDPESMLVKGRTGAAHISRNFYRDRKMVRTQTHILELAIPVISAVHSWCMGGGTWLALASDITLASEDAVFAQPEVRQISNTSFLWTLFAGYKNALRYGLTGDHVDAKEAHRIGLINDVLPDRDALMEEAFRLANRISMVSPETVAANKYVATLGMEMMGLRNALISNWMLSTVAHSSVRPDYRRKEMDDAGKERGMRGFLEVRDGPFQPEPFGPRSKPRDS